MNASARFQIQWIAYTTLVRKDIRRFLRIWRQTLIPPIITTSLYFMIFGLTIGKRVGTMDDVPYINFITPGLIALTIILQSYNHVVSSVFGERFSRSIEEILSSPMSRLGMLLGYLTAGIARGLSTGMIVAAIGYLFTNYHITLQIQLTGDG